jgi:hypothetical protein
VGLQGTTCALHGNVSFVVFVLGWALQGNDSYSILHGESFLLYSAWESFLLLSGGLWKEMFFSSPNVFSRMIMFIILVVK